MNILQTGMQLQTRKRVLPKTAEDYLIGQALHAWNPWDSTRVRRPLCYVARQAQQQQFLRGGSTPRFFAQLRSVGSKKDQLAGLCQNLPWTTGPVKKPLAAAGSKKRHPLSWMPSLFEVKKLSLRELRRAASCLQAVLLSALRVKTVDFTGFFRFSRLG